MKYIVLIDYGYGEYQVYEFDSLEDAKRVYDNESNNDCEVKLLQVLESK